MFASRFCKPAARAFTSSARRLDVARMTLIGRVGGELEPLESKSGNTYLKYPLAVKTGKEQTSWFNVLAFDPRLVDFMTTYVEKGNLIYIEADASISKWVAEDGTNRSSLTLVQQSVNPLQWKRSEDAEAEAAEAPLA